MTDMPPDGPAPGPMPLPESGEDPEQIGADLFRRLDVIDDRLRRSQEMMISLLDRHLDRVDPEAPEAGGRAWRGFVDPAEEPDGDGGADPMEAWFAGPGSSSRPRTPKDPTLFVPAATPVVAGPGGGPVVGPEAAGEVVAAEAVTTEEASVRQEEEPGRGEAGTSEAASVRPEAARARPVGGGPQAGAARTRSAPSGYGRADDEFEIVPSHRPAWQSNALTVLIAAVVVVVALFLVGLF